MTDTALLVIDVQNSFLHRPYWDGSEFRRFSDNITDLISSGRKQGWRIVYILHNEKQGAFSPKSGFVQLMDFLQPQADEPTFNKHVHNALTESGLHEWLQERGISHLKICGIRTEQCCETTTRVASDLGYQVDFVLDATLTFAMQYQADSSWTSPEQIYQHTALVLKDRFARITQTADYA